MKYHFVYKITNTIDSKFYIGVHSTSNLNDGYMGSGELIRAAIKKHGVKNFKREILAHFEDRKSALAKESELVNHQTLANPLCYNLAVGGGGGYCPVKKERPIFNKNAEDIEAEDGIIPEQFRRFKDFKVKLILPPPPILKEPSKIKSTQIMRKAVSKCWPMFADAVSHIFNDMRKQKAAEQAIAKLSQIYGTSNFKAIQEKWDV